jgi:hypothetical protein
MKKLILIIALSPARSIKNPHKNPKKWNFSWKIPL